MKQQYLIKEDEVMNLKKDKKLQINYYYYEYKNFYNDVSCHDNGIRNLYCLWR